MYLKYDNCYIMLSRAESNYILENINEKSSLKDVKSLINNLYYNSNKRYFKKSHIKEISLNLYSDYILNENYIAPGRNLRSSNSDNLSGDNSGINTASDVLNFKKLVHAEIGVDTEKSKDIVTLYFDDKEIEVIYCDSPDEANIIIKNILFKNL